jgi:hypothetical protein
MMSTYQNHARPNQEFVRRRDLPLFSSASQRQFHIIVLEQCFRNYAGGSILLPKQCSFAKTDVVEPRKHAIFVHISPQNSSLPREAVSDVAEKRCLILGTISKVG